VFRYELDAPISIERQRSAMIPILNDRLSARRVSIYEGTSGREHPMRGVEVTNDAGLQLLPGPVSVYDGDAYAGDAAIGHVGEGDERLLAYAVDLDVRVRTERDSGQRVTRVRIVDGMIERTTRSRAETVFEVFNDDELRARTVIVEHPKRGGWSLVGDATPAETTGEAYRFEVELGPNGRERLRVALERVDDQRLEVSSFGLETAIRYHARGVLSDDVLGLIRQVAAKRSELARLEERLERIETRISEIDADQDRLRSNMRAVDRTSELYGRYVSLLNEQETELAALREERAGVRREAERVREAMRELVAGKTVG